MPTNDWRKYIMPPYRDLEHARKAKTRIFGAALAGVVIKVAEAKARGNDARVAELLQHVREKKRAHVLRHADDVAPLYRKEAK